MYNKVFTASEYLQIRGSKDKYSMQIKIQNRQVTKFKLSHHLFKSGLGFFLVLIFLITYFNTNLINEVNASDDPVYNNTKSLTFGKSSQDYFYTDQISPEFNAISFWIYTPNSYTGEETYNNRVIGALDDKNQTVSFGSATSNINGETFTIKDNNGSTAIKTKIPKGWNHITINYTGTATGYNSPYEIYLNGNKEPVTHGKKIWEKINSFSVYFGKRGSKNNDYYYGGVDEVAIWNAPLSDSFIKQLPYSSLNGNETNLEAYYRFNSGTGNAEDLTHNGYTGNITNSSIWVDSSNAAIGDSLSQSMNNTRGIYHNKGSAVSTELEIKGALSNGTYAVFGHLETTGTTDIDGPTSPSYSNFFRFKRSWYVDTFNGSVKGDLVFDVENLLDSTYQNSNYILLKRSSINNNFKIASDGADSNHGSFVEFKNITLEEQYYTIGIKDTTSLTTGASLKTPKHAGQSIGVGTNTEAHFPRINNEKMKALQFWIYSANEYSTDQTLSGRYIGSPAKGIEMVFGEANNSVSGETFTIQDNNGSTFITDTVQSGWNHVTLNWNASQGRYDIHINGDQKSVGNNQGGCDLINAPELLMGKIYDKNNFFDGEIDHIAIWNSSLTTQEVRNHMCKRLSGNENNLLGLWHMDNSDTLTVFDHVNSNNARLIGSISKNASGADLGTNSKFVYNSSDWSNEELLFGRGNGDTFRVNNIQGDPTSLQIYLIDTVPNYTNLSGNLQSMLDSHHFAVNLKGDGNATYDVVYEYDPSLDYESDLDLAYRDNNAVTEWSEGNASLDTGSNILTLSNQSGTHYVLASENSSALPVELVEFRANYSEESEKVNLFWSTASEDQNKHFVIERRTNNNKFLPIGKIQGHGTTFSAHDYRFIDNNLPENNDVIYYRLKQVDYDGTYEHLTIKTVYLNDKDNNQVRIYPNPFEDQLAIKIKTSHTQTMQLRLFDNKGVEVDKRIISVIPAKGTYHYMPNKKLKKGLYYLKLRAHSIHQHFKVLKK